jgi:hypothetical protein
MTDPENCGVAVDVKVSQLWECAGWRIGLGEKMLLFVRYPKLYFCVRYKCLVRSVRLPNTEYYGARDHTVDGDSGNGDYAVV